MARNIRWYRYVKQACRPLRNQFGIIGIQVAGEDVYLNVLMKDASGLSRYFHLYHAEIPFTSKTASRVKPLISLLLNPMSMYPLMVNHTLLYDDHGDNDVITL